MKSSLNAQLSGFLESLKLKRYLKSHVLSEFSHFELNVFKRWKSWILINFRHQHKKLFLTNYLYIIISDLKPVSYLLVTKNTQKSILHPFGRSCFLLNIRGNTRVYFEHFTDEGKIGHLTVFNELKNSANVRVLSSSEPVFVNSFFSNLRPFYHK